MPPTEDSVAAAQVGIDVPVTLSVKFTVPFGLRLPDGAVRDAVKVTDSLTAEGSGVEETARVVVALFTAWVSEPPVTEKFESPL